MGSLCQASSVSISIRSEDVNVVPPICRVDFRSILLEINELVMSYNTLGGLVNCPSFYYNLFIEVNRLIKNCDVALFDQVSMIITEHRPVLL